MNKLRERHYRQVRLFVVSDSIGETAQRVINAVLAQFPDLNNYEIKKFPFVDSKEVLTNILSDALQEKAVVVTTLVNEELNELCADFARRTGLEYVDYMSPLVKIVSERTQMTPSYQSGSLYLMDEDYFNRVEAIEFSVRYDDGKDPKGFAKSDLVILGISRTSKTPLSMYLANRSFKVSNLPLIPEVPVPKEIFQIDSRRIIGLTADPEYIRKVRQSRLVSLGLTGSSSYVSLERIKEELKYSQNLYQQLGATIINVENKSIEESAQLIEEHAKSF
ncbi:pyruvate, water dikinase regulatory protein [Vagococcus fluvialis]|jgi:regulator of PEP synthase PpsR (kinase-PPPase family)|uniref:Putative pyruvate, phosphate dikinase regulatory protein n=1 Tax=Vagococcus fluvialis TaxID=2738 RepID=A0A7X6I3W4_9ENTE|nr:pyruvate, water dikinase regulatory protein [Vagococcus fluvialis]MDR2277442.1 kinase/pyrophosphorylase [Vagococcus sp.]MBO0438581.1 kinase/pyrophosphorylase [Vagococcus fluvialis]MCM2139731.1 kinase/pyrophosphorylase [Vagococcus fluvialis]MDT2780529.1 kinase/pyrophosphorylase [Vagococcus fluvialis]NKC58825.1 kinase/pyrophosphorylase [Vagococcus fluvialis]